jgi:hypothetical protein
MLLQKSPQNVCEIEMRNNGIAATVSLNRCCAQVPDLESMLRTQGPKILLQQYRPQPEVLGMATELPLSQELRTSRLPVWDARSSGDAG